MIEYLKRLAENAGLKTVEVPLDDLVAKITDFKGKWVKTEGMYIPLQRKVVTTAAILNAGTLIGSIAVPRFIVSEQGVMFGDTGLSVLRVYQEFNFGPHEKRAQEVSQRIPQGTDVTFEGDVREGFPNEFYLRTGWRPGIYG